MDSRQGFDSHRDVCERPEPDEEHADRAVCIHYISMPIVRQVVLSGGPIARSWMTCILINSRRLFLWSYAPLHNPESPEGNHLFRGSHLPESPMCRVRCTGGRVDTVVAKVSTG